MIGRRQAKKHNRQGSAGSLDHGTSCSRAAVEGLLLPCENDGQEARRRNMVVKEARACRTMAPSVL
eukprot:613092-Pelagomonas_calceolata.AAC.3